MSRWFRVDDDIINDPKILLLPEAMRWIWMAFLCIASKNSGTLPSIEIIALSLRVKPPKATEYMGRLRAAGLIDQTEIGFAPHNWAARQYKTDTVDETAAERMRRYRERKRNERNAAVTVTRTREQITETETEKKDPAASAAGADAPIDHRKRLFDEGLPKLARMTGKGPDACRSFVGKCLKAASDDAVTVLGLIEEAERNQAVDPSAWIAARLKTTEIGNGKAKYGIMEAADSLRRKVASFDGPASENLDLRDGARPVVAGLLPQR